MFANRAGTYFRFYNATTESWEEKLATAEQYKVLGRVFDAFSAKEETDTELNEIYQRDLKFEQSENING